MAKREQRRMKVNVNHPSFISFLENISQNILSAINIKEYFGLSDSKKLKVSFTVLNLLKNSAKVRANLSDSELKNFIAVLCKKNEEAENYEFAAVLNDVVKNFDSVSKMKPAIKKEPTLVVSKKPNKKTPIDPSKEGESGSDRLQQ